MFDLTPEEARLLLNVAMMAVGGNRFRSAEKIFAVLERFRPDAPQVAAGRALAYISSLDFTGCVDYIDNKALVKFPGDPMLQAFKGMALLRMNRRSDARPSLEAAAGQSQDQAAAQLARDLLED